MQASAARFAASLGPALDWRRAKPPRLDRVPPPLALIPSSTERLLRERALALLAQACAAMSAEEPG